MASGSGTNLQALIDAATPNVDIVGVIADRVGVGALQRAESATIPTRVIRWTGHDGRDSFTTAICDAVDEFAAEGLVLAGFMRILGPEAIRRFPQRILNIHPSLLPAFPGAHAIANALAYGARLTGVTVHFVDEEVDHGPIIAQRAVPILPDDDERSLHTRIQEEEHVLYPQVVEEFASGRLDVVGRMVRRR